MARLKGPPPDAITVWPRRSVPNSGFTRSAHDFGGSVTSAELYVIVQALPERGHRRSARGAPSGLAAAVGGALRADNPNHGPALTPSENSVTSANLPVAPPSALI